jgi:CBS domain-containing protein
MAGAGFARCQGGVMAVNPRWCRTSAEWIAELTALDGAVEDERLLRATVMFDLRFVAGNKAVCNALRDAILAAATTSVHLQHALAQQVVATAPPLNFIGRFVMEKLGAGEETFDLKSRGLAPLRDAARVLCLKHRLTSHYSTGGRWEEIRRHLPQFAELAASARDAYDFLLRLRTLNGLQRGDSGRQIASSALTKIERAQLSSIFDVVRLVQDAVARDFQLNARP